MKRTILALLACSLMIAGCTQPPATTGTTTPTAVNAPAVTTPPAASPNPDNSPTAATSPGAAAGATASPAANATSQAAAGVMDLKAVVDGTGIDITPPPDWKQEPNKEGLGLSSPDSSTRVLLVVARSDDVDAATKEALEQIRKDKQSTVLVEPKKQEGTALPSTRAEGTTSPTREMTLKWQVTTFGGGGKKCLQVIAIGKLDSSADALKSIYDSVKKKVD